MAKQRDHWGRRYDSSAVSVIIKKNNVRKKEKGRAAVIRNTAITIVCVALWRRYFDLIKKP